MKELGKILKTFSATKETSGLPRPIVSELNLIENHGIQNDKFAGKKLDQTVMIVGVESYEIAKQNNIDLEIGCLGENILLDFDPHDFEVGKQLFIEETILEITQICTVCSHLSLFDNNLPTLLKGHRGLYCRIIKSGIIKENMIVKG